MNPVIVIPSYVSARRRKEGGSILTTYDHTTPLSQPGELARCLDSLQRVVDIGPIVILVASEPSIEIQAAEKIQIIASKFPDLNIVVIGAPEQTLISQRMESFGAGQTSLEIGLAGYGAIRNLGLLVANILGFDAVVFIDDDEVIKDPEFLHNAMYGLGKQTSKGVPILAKSGFFYNSKGSYLSASHTKWYDRYWQQGKAFNKWITKAMQGPRLSRSNYVCGGCFVLHKEVFMRLSFDPWITRGEDLDYMLNLRMYGSDMWFDNQWSLVHLPPESPSEGTRFRQDIYRWLYEFRKLEYSYTQIDLMQVKPSALEPYPGPFLENKVMKQIRRTAHLRSIARPDKKVYRKAAKAVAGEANTYAQRNCSKYFEFQFLWPEIMVQMESDVALTTALVQSVELRRAGVNANNPALFGSPSRGIDPGKTSEIRLNIAE
ncbi:MAG: glycosyltransferase family 2 protein [Eggerthellaceae bacterium]|nr:glycosyltransferase family 2 protein [Eggerthellaceae bacterium]